MAMNFLKQKAGLQQQQIKQSQMIVPFYKPPVEETLAFDSVFESGNLALAIKESETEYNLVL